MGDQVFAPAKKPNTVIDSLGTVLTVPPGWALLPPGDAALTRRVKAAGPHWILQEKKGRKTFSYGIYAPESTITEIKEVLVAERSTDAYAKRKQADDTRREKAQEEYVEDFVAAVRAFLRFAECYQTEGQQLAELVAKHATPVGSGTVARTKRIPIEQRAEAAVIAWLRHQTTGYDSMVIPRVKGKRREVRRMLAKRSHELLTQYRHGAPIPNNCPLKIALAKQSG